MAKKMKKSVQKEEVEKNPIKRQVSELFEIPREIILNLPLVTVTGNREMSIENYKGVIEYTEEKIRINTSCGIMKIEGKNLFLKQITSEHILIIGIINKFEYL